jgi:hypothetical protein
MIDGQRENPEHQVTEHLGVAAHPYIARTEIILHAAINALSGAALVVTHLLGKCVAGRAPGQRLGNRFFAAETETPFLQLTGVSPMTAQASDAIVYKKTTDKSVVDPVFDQFLVEKARVIRALGVSNVIETGKHLSEVRSALSQKGGTHKGEWLRWLKRQVGFSEHTARRDINVFEVFGSNATRVSHWNLPLRSLYELAAPTTPEPARAQVLGCLEAGKKLPYREIKAVIAAHTLKEDQPQLEQPEAHVAMPVEKACASAAPRRESVSVGRVQKETPARDELSDTEKIKYLENRLAKDNNTIGTLKGQLAERDATIKFLKKKLEKARIGAVKSLRKQAERTKLAERDYLREEGEPPWRQMKLTQQSGRWSRE